MATQWYVITIEVTGAGYKKIDHKLPAYIKTVTGIHCTVNGLPFRMTTRAISAFVSLGFNEGTTQPFYQVVEPSTSNTGGIHNALPLCEHLHTNSVLQGYVKDEKPTDFSPYPYSIKIYLSYLSHE